MRTSAAPNEDTGVGGWGSGHPPPPVVSLYGHVNAGWLAATPVPEARAQVNPAGDVSERVRDAVGGLITAGAPGCVRARVLYDSFLDEDAVDSLGPAALAADLDTVARARSVSDLCSAFGALTRRGVLGPLEVWVGPDDGSPRRYAAHVDPSGATLPDPSLYLDAPHTGILELYRGHVADLLALAGFEDAAGRAAKAVELEVALAAGCRPAARSRDAGRSRGTHTVEQLSAMAAPFDWDAWAAGLSGGRWGMTPLVVSDPHYLAALGDLLRTVPVEGWRHWLTARVLNQRATFLSRPFVDAYFEFFGRGLLGMQGQSPRRKRGLDLVLAMLGGDVGAAYVSHVHDASRRKAVVERLAEHVRTTFIDHVAGQRSLTRHTRDGAVAKLRSATIKVGFPDRPAEASAAVLDPAGLVENVSMLSAEMIDREAARIGLPFDPTRWAYTGPHVPNLRYDAAANEVVVPLAVLQAPYLELDGSDAERLGRIGALIAHELGHALDDVGVQFDSTGHLQDWSDPADRDHIAAQVARVQAHFDGLRPVDAPSGAVDGTVTLGENLADIVGLTMASAALRSLVPGSGAAGQQVLFKAWAAMWRARRRPQAAVSLLASDPHSPPDIRCDQVVRHVTSFHQAFGTRPGDPMWLDPGDRLDLW